MLRASPLEGMREPEVQCERGLIVFRIVLICTGNTCRSPMAESILSMLLSAEKLGGNGDMIRTPIQVSSAGVAAGEGMPATPEACAVSEQQGLDLSAHRSRGLTPEMILNADLIVAMEEHHRQAAVRLMPECADRITTLSELAGLSSARGVADPIGGDENRYRETFAQLEDLLKRAVPRIVTLTRDRASDPG